MKERDRPMRHGLLFVSVLLNPLIGQAATNFLEDIAHNPRTGDTYVLEQTSAGKPVITALSEKGDAARQIALPSDDVTEIELMEDGRLMMVVNANGYWAVTDGVHSAGGAGFARDAHALPGGVLAVTEEKSNGADPQVVLIASDSNEIADRVPVADVEAALAAAELKSGGADYATTSGLGFAAGLQSAIGLAYRKHFEDKWGMQIAAGGFGDDDNVRANLGLTVMRTLHKAETVRFYAMAGASVFYEGYRSWTEPEACAPDQTKDECASTTRDSTDSTWVSDTMINLGLGLGIEFRMFKRVGLAFELPFTASYVVSGTEGASRFQSLYMIPNGSLIYYF